MIHSKVDVPQLGYDRHEWTICNVVIVFTSIPIYFTLSIYRVLLEGFELTLKNYSKKRGALL
jgi:hypothetical protein